jgi:hypothetical protein
MLKYFELREVIIEDPKPGEFRLETAAVLSCSLCGTMIDGMGGPGDGAICLRCGAVVKNGQARGAIVWPAEGQRG